MANIPTTNNNPGDLKDPSTGNFQKFDNSQDGFNALKGDLQGKITGNTKTGLNGNSTLQQFASTWAPDSDGNNSSQYAQNLAKKLGVTTDTPIGKLSGRIDDFANAIADNEGYQGNRVAGETDTVNPAIPEANAGSKLSTADFAAKIKSKYPQYQNVDDNTLTQKILAKYPQYASQVDTGSASSSTAPSTAPSTQGGYDTSTTLPPTSSQSNSSGDPGILGDISQGNFGGAAKDAGKGLLNGATSLANDIASPFAGLAAIPLQAGVAGYNKLTGSNIPDPFSKAGGNTSGLSVSPLDVGSKANDLVGAGEESAEAAGGGLLGRGAGLIASSVNGGSALKSPLLDDALPIARDKFDAMTASQKGNVLKQALSYANSKPGGDVGNVRLLSKALEELGPSIDKELGLVPGALKSVLGRAGSLAKGGIKKAAGSAVGFGLGAEAKNIFDHLTQ